MQIGQVIRQYRKKKDMTQEEMANRLGVTAPAVNKWENGNSMPDITLLAPIARLLDISLDTLLSFREELTQEEIQDIIQTVYSMLREKPFAEAFEWAKEKIEQYPNCEPLYLEAAVLLGAERMKQADTDERYETTINQWYTMALGSEQEQIRTMAADRLFHFYLDKKQYDKAEEYLTYFSEQNPERKRKQAVIYSRTDRREEAYKAYEELLLSMYQTTILLFRSIGMLAQQDQNMDKVRMIVEKASDLEEIFDMGEYHKVLWRHELAIMEQDAETVITTMQQMLTNIDDINHFTESSLFEHMTFAGTSEELRAQLREDIVKAFRDEETYGFLKGDSRWEDLKS
ncbi:MAG: helix-turn-helix transcriptional regulator [Lachnospiraceae bacterium]|nr:helix-turn-helix transcriptional regulator [Lachnospiraceae bacterium]MBD5513609.1 helix-turn-helix transcriptional regulator [Lachnospiraceae bacterium]